jgi:hypothetical protein
MAKKMQEHSVNYCQYCDADLPRKGYWKNYCGKDCARKDGDDWSATESGKWAYYNEV